jgi:hypothetical protein
MGTIVLIATIFISGYREVSITHVEHDYPSYETCEAAYDEVYHQAHQLSSHASVVGKCLKVK